MKVMPSVQKFMTYLSKTIDVYESVSQANDLMRKLHLRYLPITKAGVLVGILTDREVHFILSRKDYISSSLKIDDIYSNNFLSVQPTMAMDEVLSKMIEKRVSCVVVIENEKPIGIFTEVDAYKRLSDTLSIESK